MSGESTLIGLMVGIISLVGMHVLGLASVTYKNDKLVVRKWCNRWIFVLAVIISIAVAILLVYGLSLEEKRISILIVYGVVAFFISQIAFMFSFAYGFAAQYYYYQRKYNITDSKD